jgi:hypothetical protein
MSMKGWVSPSHSERKSFDEHASVVGPVHGHPDNREVTSKNTRRYGRNETTGQQPADIYRDPVPPSMPATHVGRPGRPHVETVGWHPHTHEFVKATHPEAEARGHGNAVYTHEPLRPEGLAHDASGGEHGRKSVAPEKKRVAQPERVGPETLGRLQRRRDRDPAKPEQQPKHNR